MQLALPTNRHFSKSNGNTEMNKNKVSAFTELVFFLNSVLIELRNLGKIIFFPHLGIGSWEKFWHMVWKGLRLKEESEQWHNDGDIQAVPRNCGCAKGDLG